jgi:spore coat polysaccharide biosynthesis predicted glycosyltransferase SpsG/RimJ/RimL family protein N-acetyltransferase
MNIYARDASIEDSMLVLDLRNQQEAKNAAQITTAEHESWYRNRLEYIHNQPFWIFGDSKKEIGYVRLENSSDFENSFELSIAISKDLIGQGIGTKILNQALNMLSVNFTSKRIIARINSKNDKSLKLFEKAGFNFLSGLNDFRIYEKKVLPIRFVFRADASNLIGSGHVMRILGLMEEIVSRKFQVVFIGDVTGFAWIYEKIKALDIEIFSLHESKFLKNKLADILIIDSYAHSTNSEFLELEKWKSVIVFFDAYTPNYQATLKVYPGLRKKWPDFSGQKAITGPSYIPLRKSILRIPAAPLSEKLVITVVGGGVDKFNFAAEIARTIGKLSADFEANFFVNNIGGFQSDPRFNILPIGAQLDTIGNKSELIFTTASTTCLEFIARGCVVGVCCTVENQRQLYEELPILGVAAPIGQVIRGIWKLNLDLIEELITSKELREKYKKNTRNLIDLSGANRIFNEILSL